MLGEFHIFISGVQIQKLSWIYWTPF